MEDSYITLTFKIDPEDALFVSSCPDLGIFSQGDTIDEALANIKDAAATLLQELDEFGEVDAFLSERHIVKHPGRPNGRTTDEESVKVRSGEIVSVLQALLGSTVAFVS